MAQSTMQHFIEQANHYGKQRTPFFFLIDFEKEKPLICPLENSAQQGIYFDILGKRNCTISPRPLPLNFTKHPMPFSHYQQGFELVQSELQKVILIY